MLACTSLKFTLEKITVMGHTLYSCAVVFACIPAVVLLCVVAFVVLLFMMIVLLTLILFEIQFVCWSVLTDNDTACSISYCFFD